MQLMELLALIAVVIGIVAYFVGMALISMFTLGPILAPARKSKARTQFMLSDIIWLVLLTQLLLGLVSALPMRQVPAYAAVVYFLALVGAVGVWWCGMRMASAVGLRSAWRRAVLIVIVTPLVVVLVMSWLPALFISLVGVIHLGHGEGPLRTLLGKILATLALPLVVALAFGLRRTSRWIVAEPPQEKPDEEELFKIGEG